MLSNASDRSGPRKGKVSLTSLYFKKNFEGLIQKRLQGKNDIDECYRTERPKKDDSH